MSPEEERKILSHCVEVETLQYERKGKQVNATKHQAKRGHLKVVIILAVDTGLRCNELRTLSWEDIDMATRVINVRSYNTKTQKARKVGMTARVYDELVKLGPGTGRLFTWTTVRRSFNTARTRAGIKDLRFHDLRHTATTRMIRAGIPHTEVMKITGHTQIKTFLRYLNLMDDAIQSAAEKLQQFNYDRE
jgi:integrase